jgi:hypothetical protein
VTTRIEEARLLPQAVADFEEALSTARAFHSVISAVESAAASASDDDKDAEGETMTTTPGGGRFAPGELESFLNSIKTHETWLEGKRGVQEVSRPNEDPVLRTRELERRAREVRDEMAKLSRRKAPPAAKKPSSSSTSPTSSATSSKATTTDAESTPSVAAPDESERRHGDHDEL